LPVKAGLRAAPIATSALKRGQKSVRIAGPTSLPSEKLLLTATDDSRTRCALGRPRAITIKAHHRGVHGNIAFEGGSADELNNNDLIRQFCLGM
jgi:hypothetical protein